MRQFQGRALVEALRETVVASSRGARRNERRNHDIPPRG
jgi:hypothetical protein